MLTYYDDVAVERLLRAPVLDVHCDVCREPINLDEPRFGLFLRYGRDGEWLVDMPLICDACATIMVLVMRHEDCGTLGGAGE